MRLLWPLLEGEGTTVHWEGAEVPDGIFVVPLAPVDDPEQVVPTIAQTLSIGQVVDAPLLATNGHRSLNKPVLPREFFSAANRRL